MPARTLEALRSEYEQLFAGMKIHPERLEEVDRTVDVIVRHRAVYEAVMDALGVPWQVVGILHCMESGLNFRTHLHNGDPLTARTVQVPSGRPRTGAPPFTFQESAIDALRLKNLDRVEEWDAPATLFHMERYNGFGYRSRRINTPYLWSFSNRYTKGKFVQDGRYDPEAVSAQCGGATLLRRMVDREIHAFTGLPRIVRVTLDGVERPASAFVQKGNSWIAPRQLESLVPESRVVAVRQNPLTISVEYRDRVRAFEGRMFRGTGHVDASDLLRDFFGFDLVYSFNQGCLMITR